MKSLVFIPALLWVGLGASSAEDEAFLLGSWKATADRPNGETSESTLEITKKDSNLTGEATLEGGQKRPFKKVEVDGKKVLIDIDFEYDGQALTVRVKAEETEKGELSGKWYAIGPDGDELVEENWAAVRTSEPEPSDSKSTSILGKWNATSSTDDGEEMASVVIFTKDGDAVKGSSESDRGKLDFDSVKLEGKDVEIELTLDINGNEVPITIRSTQAEVDHLKGKWIVFNESGEEYASGEWNAKRAQSLDLAGTWAVLASTDNGDLELESVFEKTASGYKGTSKSERGSTDYTLVSVNENAVKLEVPFGGGEVNIEAKLAAKNKLDGQWRFFDDSGSEAASGKWVATKQVEEATVSVAGEWAIELAIGDFEPRDYTLKIAEEGDALTGVFISPRSGETKCDSVVLKDSEIEFRVTRAIQGMDIEFIYKGKLADDTFSGSMVPKGYEDEFSGTWKGKRK